MVDCRCSLTYPQDGIRYPTKPITAESLTTTRERPQSAGHSRPSSSQSGSTHAQHPIRPRSAQSQGYGVRHLGAYHGSSASVLAQAAAAPATPTEGASVSVTGLAPASGVSGIAAAAGDGADLVLQQLQMLMEHGEDNRPSSNVTQLSKLAGNNHVRWTAALMTMAHILSRRSGLIPADHKLLLAFDTPGRHETCAAILSLSCEPDTSSHDITVHPQFMITVHALSNRKPLHLSDVPPSNRAIIRSQIITWSDDYTQLHNTAHLSKVV
eukprot:jgi/Chrzof1/11792/Cz06g10090.t1